MLWSLTFPVQYGAVFAMNDNGAPVLMGFVVFSIILSGISLLRTSLNSNVVVLIPKHSDADRIEHFRPMALANVHFIIITEVLADRLALVAPKIVSDNQRGFIRGRQIADCICTASEAINLLKKRAFGGQIALKIDIKKVFDT